jgi:hypothetical protein
MTRLWSTQPVDGLAMPSATYQRRPTEIPSSLPKDASQTTDKGEYPAAHLSEEQREILDLRKMHGDFRGISNKDISSKNIQNDTIPMVDIDDVPGMPHEFNTLRRKFLSESDYYDKNERRIETLISSFSADRTEDFINAFEKNIEKCGIAMENAVHAFKAKKQNKYGEYLADAQRSFSLFENQMKMLRTAWRN